MNPTGRPAAFFDFDNTLLADDSAKIGCLAMWKMGLIPVRVAIAIIVASVLFKFHWISTQTMVRRLLGIYRGKPISLFRAAYEPYYRTQIRTRFASEVLRALARHRDAGHALVLLSAAPRYTLEPVAHELGIPHVLCSDLEIDDDGILTGRAHGARCIGPQKAALARALAEREGFDLEASYAYGDHHSDLPVLELVGHPVAVAPSAPLRAAAEARGWSIISHGERTTPESPEI